MRAATPISAVVVLLAAALTSAGCTAQPPPATAKGAVGADHLAPSFQPAAREASRVRHGGKRRHLDERSSHRPAKDRSPAGPGQPTSRTGAGSAHAAPPGSSLTASRSGPAAATVGDRAGDVAGGFGAPSYVDLTGARLEETGRSFVLHALVAAPLPARQNDAGKTMNLASFYDVDADGTIDYEVWATLADDGWHGAYRYPKGARFGSDSGVSVRAEGRELVVRFPRKQLGNAGSFQWAVGSEWGSYEQISTGTTASDHAPDDGAVRFPG